MYTPRKSSNFSSPYGQSAPQYPSQSTDFIPLHLGGLNTTPQGHQNTHGGQKNSPFHQNRHEKKSPFRGGGLGTTSTGRDWQQNKRFQRQFYRGNNRNYKYKSHQSQQKESGGQDTFSLHFHTSMLEDPWNDLVKRHEALNRSFIDTTKDISELEEQHSDSNE